MQAGIHVEPLLNSCAEDFRSELLSSREFYITASIQLQLLFSACLMASTPRETPLMLMNMYHSLAYNKIFLWYSFLYGKMMLSFVYLTQNILLEFVGLL